VGLKADGTLVATGNNEIGQCDVGDWTDIVQVAVGWGHTVGVTTDGTVVAVGYWDYGQVDVGDWTDIIQIAAGYGHTAGAKSDGTVAAVGLNDEGQCNVGDWDDISKVATGSYHTVGLSSDGTVVAAGLEVELAKWNLGSTASYLSISSTTGGEVTRPGEGSFSYYPGRTLNLEAEPENGYRFVNWTGDADTIANINAAKITITMNDSYSLTANFEEKPTINWAILGGIIAAVVVAGLVIYFVRRNKLAQTNGR
jgi:uncharacterized repeat protein (TIGR02543 family)